MKKRLIAFIMALAMVLTMVPIVALAEDDCPIKDFDTTVDKIVKYQNADLKPYTTEDGSIAYWYESNSPSRRGELKYIDFKDGTRIDELRADNMVYNDEYYLYEGERLLDFEQSPDNQLVVGETYDYLFNVTSDPSEYYFEKIKSLPYVNPTAIDRIDSIEFDKDEYVVDDIAGYTVYPKMTVNYKNGDVGIIEGDDWYSNYMDFGVPGMMASYNDAVDGYFYAYLVPEIPESEWVPGNSYKMYLYFLNYGIDKEKYITVKVEEADIASIDVKDMELYVLNGNDTVTDFYGFNATINYKDEAKEPIEKYFSPSTENTLIQIFDSNNQEIESTEMTVGNTYTLQLTYKDVTSTATITVKNHPIQSIEIVSANDFYNNPRYDFDEESYDAGNITSISLLINGETVVDCYDVYWSAYFKYNGQEYSVELDVSNVDTTKKTADISANGRAYNVLSDPYTVRIIDDFEVESITVSHPCSRVFIKNNTLTSINKDKTVYPFDLRGLELEIQLKGESFAHKVNASDIYNLYDFGEYPNGQENFGFQANSDYGLPVYFTYRDSTNDSAVVQIIMQHERLDVCTIKAQDSGIESLSLNKTLTDEEISNRDYKGLVVTVNYKDGRTEEIELSEDLVSDDAIAIMDPSIDIGTGMRMLSAVDTDKISGASYTNFRVNVGPNKDTGIEEYCSIVWNNGLFKYLDQMIFLDSGKCIKSIGDVDVSFDAEDTNNVILKNLTDEDDLYAIERLCASIESTIDAEKNSNPSNKMDAALSEDNAELVEAYDIDISYQIAKNDGTKTDAKALTDFGDSELEIAIPIPESLKDSDFDNLKLYREHKNDDGTTTVEEITNFVIDTENNAIIIKSSKFSTFAFALSKEESPSPNSTPVEKPISGDKETIAKTLDETPIAATVALLWSSGLCVYAVAKKRKEIA